MRYTKPEILASICKVFSGEVTVHLRRIQRNFEVVFFRTSKSVTKDFMEPLLILTFQVFI